ncbi:AMP phosphorylase [Candidatus Micrarchaeota archaeon]|nr:AMP phosphorylase [Candidatus Micrarchaeota archaeon]
MLQLKAKLFDVEQGQNEVAMNYTKAIELGLTLYDRMHLKLNGKHAVAILDFAHEELAEDEVGLFAEVSKLLDAKLGDVISVEPLQRPLSLDYIKKKLDGKILSQKEISAIISDLMHERLSPTELAAFISAIYINGLAMDETIALTNAISESGDLLKVNGVPVVSMHSIGGVAGDRVTMLIVPIMASLGLKIPKTAARAISSASGTADAMEVLCPVALSVVQIENAIQKTNGCIVWGGAVRLASADDKLIKIRNPLRLDPKSLLLSSILAKKKAEGAKFVLIDIPIGKGAKIERIEEGRALARDFESLGLSLGMQVRCLISDGSSPLSNGIGPALEAKEILATFENNEHNMLFEKACQMCGILLHMVKGISQQEGYEMAIAQMNSGKAFLKFKEIIAAQGGNPTITSKDIKIGEFRAKIFCDERGKVSHIDNVAISKICRLLGAPADKRAGMILKVKKGDNVEKGDEVAEIVASSKQKIDFAMQNLHKAQLMEVEKIIIDLV